MTICEQSDEIFEDICKVIHSNGCKLTQFAEMGPTPPSARGVDRRNGRMDGQMDGWKVRLTDNRS